MNVKELIAILEQLHPDLVVRIAIPGGSYVEIKPEYEVRQKNDASESPPNVMFESN